jgi:hypothetical protein
MRNEGEIFVVHRLLDEQILDSDGKRCGRVDDIELRVPWEEFDEIGATLRLRRKAEELGLGEGDDPERWMVRRLPWN